jgi:hypothetical protein
MQLVDTAMLCNAGMRMGKNRMTFVQAHYRMRASRMRKPFRAMLCASAVCGVISVADAAVTADEPTVGHVTGIAESSVALESAARRGRWARRRALT